jgi:hypothetical protein
MGRPVNRRKLLTQAVVLMVVIFGLIAWFVHAERKPFDQNQLKIEIGKLRSYAADAELLAEQALSTKVTQTFFQTQTYLLHEKIETSRSSLEDTKVEPRLEEKHWLSRQVAGQLNSAIESLSVSFVNPEEMNRASTNLKRLSSELKQLEESLKQ